MTRRGPSKPETVAAVVLAAGRGARFGGTGNKIFAQVAGRAILAHALLAFAREEEVQEIVLVFRPGEEGPVREAAAAVPRPVRLVAGGERRQDSALAGVAEARSEIVLVHDAARPFPSSSLIRRVIEAARAHGAAAAAIPVADTLRYAQAEGSLLPGRVDRHRLFAMQTPQGFRRDLLLDALKAAPGEVTDEAEAVIARGDPVFTVEGEVTNLKITTRADLALAEAIARSPSQATSHPLGATQ